MTDEQLHALAGVYRRMALNGLAAEPCHAVISPDGRKLAVAFTNDDAELIVASLNRWRRPSFEVSEPQTDLVGAWNRAIERALERGAHALSPAIREMRDARDAMAAVLVASQAYRREYGDGGRDKQREVARAYDVALAKLVGVS